MEQQLALVNKQTKRVENIIVVDSYDDLELWATKEMAAVPIDNKTVYLFGTWDGKKFTAPDDEYLTSLGLLDGQA